MSQRWWRKLLGWEYLGLATLVLMTLVLHLSIIMQPAEPLFDEQHYVPDSRSILSGQGDYRPEHPPLSKMFIAAGMSIFGDNPFGWRVMSVVAGTLLIVVFYLICKQLAMSREASLIATYLLALENMTFVQASIAMLDVFYVLLMLSAFLVYLKGRFVFSGVLVALSSVGKLVGVLAVPTICLHWLATRRVRMEHILLIGAVSALAFPAGLFAFRFATTGQWENPIETVKTMLSMSGSLTFATATSDITTRPWLWVIEPIFMWYWYDPHYMGAISFNLWALVVPAVGYMVYRALRRDNAATFGVAWFVSTYLLWIPLSIFTDRISFVFYFYPSIGAICLGLGLGLSRLLDVWRTHTSKVGRRGALGVVVGYLTLHAIVFVILAPVFTRWTPFIRP